MTIGNFYENQSRTHADTNVPLVLIGSSGCNLQYKPFCDWLTLIERLRHPSKVSGFPINCASVYGLSRGYVKQWGFVAISAITALHMALLNVNSKYI